MKMKRINTNWILVRQHCKINRNNNNNTMKTILHETVQQAILDACESAGIRAEMEYKGDGYVADVMAFVNEKKYAFEVQVSRQSLNKTKERQEKYLHDGVTCCWLFEIEPGRESVELESLPIFQLVDTQDGIGVSLKGRKILSIKEFVLDFVEGKIKFCNSLKPLPIITVRFVEMQCWRCGSVNHIYFLEPFHTACNIELTFDEMMWVNDKFSFNPQIIEEIKKYSSTEAGKHLNLSTIKERFSRTVGRSYMSFGCSKCDSIFGDWYVQEAMIDTLYDEPKDIYSFELDLDLPINMDIPHWCHPGEHDFCE